MKIRKILTLLFVLLFTQQSCLAEITVSPLQWEQSRENALHAFARSLLLPETELSRLYAQHLNQNDTFTHTSQAVVDTVLEKGVWGQLGNELLLLLTDPTSKIADQFLELLGVYEDNDVQSLLQDIVVEVLAGTETHETLWDSFVMEYIPDGTDLVGELASDKSAKFFGAFLNSQVETYNNVSMKLLKDQGHIVYDAGGTMQIVNKPAYYQYINLSAFTNTNRFKQTLDEYWALMEKNGDITRMVDGSVMIRNYDAYYEYLELSWTNVGVTKGADDAFKIYQQGMDTYWNSLVSSNAITLGADGKSIIINDATAYRIYANGTNRMQNLKKSSRWDTTATWLNAAGIALSIINVNVEYGRAKDTFGHMVENYAVNMPLLDAICDGTEQGSIIYQVCDKLRSEIQKGMNQVKLNLATVEGVKSFLKLLTEEGIDVLIDKLNNPVVSSILLGGQTAGMIPLVKDAVTLAECEKEMIQLLTLENLLRNAIGQASKNEKAAAFYLLEIYYAVHNRGLECCQKYYATYYDRKGSVMDVLLKKQDILKEQHDLFEEHMELRRAFVEYLGDELGFNLYVTGENPYDYTIYDKQRLELMANASEYAKKLSSSSTHTLCLHADGTVFDFGAAVPGLTNPKTSLETMYGTISLGTDYDWKDIVQVSAGHNFSAGLRKDGTVVAEGINDYQQCNTDDWTDIIDIDCGIVSMIGVRKDGTVAFTGALLEGCEYDYASWTNIIEAAVGYTHIVGLRADGTVVATGDNDYGQCEVEQWHDIVAVDAGVKYTIGLQADGNVLLAGWLDRDIPFDSSVWKDIVSISAGSFHMVGLNSYGLCVNAGARVSINYNTDYWSNLVALSAGNGYTVGIQADGKLVALGGTSSCSFHGILDQVPLSVWLK